MSTYIGNVAYILDKYIDLNKLENGWEEYLIISDPSENLQKYADIPIQSYDNNEEFHPKLVESGYRGPSWIGKQYYSNVHVPKELIYELDEVFGTVCSAFNISELTPGNIAPPHQDIEYKRENFYREFGTWKRFHIHVGQPQFGHAFFVENNCHYMEDHGAAYIWDDPDAWHAGVNAGFGKKYLMGYKGIVFNDNRKVQYQFPNKNNAEGCFIGWEGYNWQNL